MLFDMGQATLVANARSLNVNLAAIDSAVLSHGHYDHGGGLRAFFNTNDHVPVYISRHAFEKHGNTLAGISGLISLSSHRPIFTDDYQKISNGLELLSCNTRQPLFPFTHSVSRCQSVIICCRKTSVTSNISSSRKMPRILISGCSHKNVLNLVEWFNPMC